MDDPRLSPALAEEQRFWDLPTGSRIAYVRLAAEGRANPTPVVFLHGGPGVPDMRGDSEYFGRLWDVLQARRPPMATPSNATYPNGLGIATDGF